MPCFFWNGSLYCGAQLHDARHVGFVEGGQDRGGLLGFDQALGDPLAQAAHALAGLAGTGRWGGRRGLGAAARRAGWPWPAGGRSRWRCGRALAAAGGASRKARTSPLVIRPPGPVPATRRRRRPARRPAGGPPARAVDPRRPVARRRGAGAAGAASRPFGRLGGRRGAAAGAGRPAAAQVPDGSIVPTVAPIGDGLALGHADLQDPEPGAGTTLRGLVGLELEERLAGLHRDAVGLEPARQDALGDRFAHARAR